MAARNSVKSYIENSFYHIYNRGVEKRDIFLEQQDYSVFLDYLKTYLEPKDKTNLQQIINSSTTNFREKDKAIKSLRLNNFADEIDLICYSLMPNHFHFLIRQKSADAIDKFLNSLATRYAMYFNRKYKRVGVLFQGVYKAVPVNSDEYLLHLTRYIHLNPSRHPHGSLLPSSLPDFLGKRQTKWVKPGFILDYFSKTNKNNSYESFINSYSDLEQLKEIALDLND